MINKRLRFLCLIAAAIFLFGGCTATIPMKESSSVTLPPASAVFQAPSGDEQRDVVSTIVLYLPSATTGQLVAAPITLALPPNRHPAEAAANRLLSFSGNESVKPLIEEAPISLMPGSAVEISGDTATVNLSAAALALDAHKLATVYRALTNTLCQWGDIRYVNILIAGMQPGIDIGATLPMGSLRKTANEEALWDIPTQSERFTSVATLYYPASLGKGVLAEARAVTFPGKSLSDMVRGLLTALSAEPLALTGVPRIPPLETLLEGDITVSDATSGGGRIIRLQFHEAANDVFIHAGIPRSMMMASLVMTLTTFIPNAGSVLVRIGEENIRAVVPTGVPEGGGQELVFENGLMRRSHFHKYLLNIAPLYFATDSGLKRLLRPIPAYQTQHVRYLLEQLMQGPDTAETSLHGLRATLPGGIRSADLLGFTTEKDTVLLNFSQNFLTQCKGLSEQQEQLVVYSIVNTLCELRGIRRIRFFVGGQQPDTLAGKLYLPGEFLYNPDILR